MRFFPLHCSPNTSGGIGGQRPPDTPAIKENANV